MLVLKLIERIKIMASGFEIMDTNTRQYRRYNAVGIQLIVLLIPPSDNSNPVAHFLPSVNDLFKHSLLDVDDSDMVGITIQNQVNENDNPIRVSFRRKDQFSGEVIWSVFDRISQSNSRSDVLERLVVTAYSVKMPVGFGKRAIKTRSRPLSVSWR